MLKRESEGWVTLDFFVNSSLDFQGTLFEFICWESKMTLTCKESQDEVTDKDMQWGNKVGRTW